MSSTHFHKLKVKEVRRETPECVSIQFEVPGPLRDAFVYLPGQYLTLRTYIEDKEVRRSYSICSAPASGFANIILKAGDTIEVMPPLGKFSPRAIQEKGRKYLAIAAGSGITPVMSIMHTVLDQNAAAAFTLIYGNKNRASIIFKEDIEALKNKHMQQLRVYHTFTRESMDTPLFNGRLNKEKIAAFCDKLIDLDAIDEVFICGPEDMILSIRAYLLEERHLDQHQVHFELFSSPDQPHRTHEAWQQKQQALDPTKVSRVTVRLDGRAFDMELPYVGDNILDAALQQGADLPYACKGGVCCTCRAKLVEGEVDMEVNYALEPDELANNFILTCQSHPRTERVVVDFDIK
jgi:ring-1,2-phenylacetyl-CoA epoxidase subunit PaaE